MTDVREVRFDTIVRAEPEKVYDAIATAEGLDSWFTSGTELEARPGGSLVLRWKDWGVEKFTGEITGSVVEARGNEMIEYDGELHTAANLHDALKEGYYGRF